MNKSELDTFPFDDLYFGGIVFSEMKNLVSMTPLAWTQHFADLGVELSGVPCRFLEESRFGSSLKLETGEHIMIGVVGAENHSDQNFSLFIGIFDEDGKEGNIFHIWKGERWSYASGVKAVREGEMGLCVKGHIELPELKRVLSDDKIVSCFSRATPQLKEMSFAKQAEAERELLSKVSEDNILHRCGVRA